MPPERGYPMCCPAPGQRRRRSTRAELLCLSILGLSVLLAGCSALRSERIYDGGKVLEVSILGGGAGAQRSAPGKEALEGALGGVQVRRYGRFFRFSLAPPAPLFSQEQVRRLASVLQRHLPALGAEQRIQAVFHDASSGMRYRAQIGLQQGWLQLAFDEFAVDPRLFPDPDYASREEKQFNARPAPQPGQQLLRATDSQVHLLLPLSSSAQAKAKALAEKHRLAEQAAAEGILEAEALATLRRWMNQQGAALSVSDWKIHLEKRKTLKNALRQQLLTQDEYTTRLETLLNQVRP